MIYLHETCISYSFRTKPTMRSGSS